MITYAEVAIGAILFRKKILNNGTTDYSQFSLPLVSSHVDTFTFIVAAMWIIACLDGSMLIFLILIQIEKEM